MGSSLNADSSVLRLGVVTSSEVSRPDLHLGAFGGVEVSLPGQPVHAVSVRRVITVVVQPVQVGVVALVVPPGAFANHGAVHPITLVVVSVFGAEGHPIVQPQWVPRCTYVENISLSCRPILSMFYCFIYELINWKLALEGGWGSGVRGGGGVELRREFDKTQRPWGGAFDHNTRGVKIWFGASISCFDVA